MAQTYSIEFKEEACKRVQSGVSAAQAARDRKRGKIMRKEVENYHKLQMEKPYRSTEMFIEWLNNKGYFNEKVHSVCDMACGMGGNTMYLAKMFPNIKFTGIDLEQELIDIGGGVAREDLCNCKLYQGDWYNIDEKWKNKFQGIISFQTLSWLPEYESALRKLVELNPDWIAISSLFYDGDIEYTNKVRDYYRPTGDKEYCEMYYNIYSITRVRECFRKIGYDKFEYIPFEIDIDLPKISKDIGTYTVKTEDGKRIQISAGLMMPWYFIVASKLS